MMGIKQELQSTLQPFWSDRKLRLHISKQIIQSQLLLHSISSHYLYLQSNIKPNCPNNLVVFVVLSKGFPLKPPQILVKHTFLGALKQHKDILMAVIGKTWHYSITLQQIIQRLKQFWDKLDADRPSIGRLQWVGQYHMDRVYQYPILKQLCTNHPFIAFQQTQQHVKLFVLVVTHTNFLIFKPYSQPTIQQDKLVVPKQNQLNLMKLVFVGQLQSLTSISYDRSSKNQYKFQFTKVSMKRMQVSRYKTTKTLHITRSYQFIQCIIRRMRDLQIAIQLKIGDQRCEEQQQLLKNMAVVQSRLEKYLNKQNVYELNDVYQKLIQFYSMTELPYQEIFVSKISKLTQKVQVKLILEFNKDK